MAHRPALFFYHPTLGENRIAGYVDKCNTPSPSIPQRTPQQRKRKTRRHGQATTNLLYIHSDQHSPYVNECYGDPLVRTPRRARRRGSYLTIPTALLPSACRRACLCYRVDIHTKTACGPATNTRLNVPVSTCYGSGRLPPRPHRAHAFQRPRQLRGYAERLVGDHGPIKWAGAA